MEYESPDIGIGNGHCLFICKVQKSFYIAVIILMGARSEIF